MSALEGKKIAIVGGGPGGLTLARLLQQSGAEVSVYERDQGRSARVQGSALDLHEDSGLAALEAAGLIADFWVNHRPDLDRLRLTDAQGTILHDHPRPMSGAGKRPEIERGPLRELLLDSLQPGTVEWDCKLESGVMRGDQVLLRFAGGNSALADIAIGSDGANSRLRELVTPIRPEYVGVSLVEALVPAAKQTIPQLWDLLGGSALIALGSGRTIGMGTKPEGSVLMYAGLTTHGDTARQSLEEASSPDQRVAWFHANFEGWSQLWDPLFRESHVDGLASASCLPVESALGAEAQRHVDRRCSACDATVRRRRREYGNARRPAAIQASAQRRIDVWRDCGVRGGNVCPDAAHDGGHPGKHRDVLCVGCRRSCCGFVSQLRWSRGGATRLRRIRVIKRSGSKRSGSDEIIALQGRAASVMLKAHEVRP